MKMVAFREPQIFRLLFHKFTALINTPEDVVASLRGLVLYICGNAMYSVSGAGQGKAGRFEDDGGHAAALEWKAKC